MKDIDLSSMISRAKVVFDVLEKEYKVFLASEKIEMLEGIIYSNFFKVTENASLPPIYLSGDTYYLNRTLDKERKSLTSDDLYSNYLRSNNISKIYEEVVIFLCLSLMCGELNPLKIGLIELEVREISNRHGISTSSINNHKELDIAILVKEKLLNDVPFNIIFLDSDVEIFNYLATESGIEIAKFYYRISEMMSQKYQGLKDKEFSLGKFLNYYEAINYDDVMDVIYDFINTKIR